MMIDDLHVFMSGDRPFVWVMSVLLVVGSLFAAWLTIHDMRSKRARRPRVYVAGGSSERFAVRALIEEARRRGVDVVTDWTRDPGWDLGRIPTDDEFRESARRDLAAIREADVVWLVVPAQKSEGAATEIGYALGLGKRLVVSGETGARNIFALLARPEDMFARHENALAALASMRETLPRHSRA